MSKFIEIWIPVSRDPRYEVSCFGRVRSYRRSSKPKLLKPGRASNGYLTVCLGRGNTVCVHALVAEAFLGPKPFPSAEVRHLDGHYDNLRFDNLAWGSRGQNGQDKKWHRKPKSYHKLSGKQASEIKRRIPHEVGAALAREFNVSDSTISAIKHGRAHSDA